MLHDPATELRAWAGAQVSAGGASSLVDDEDFLWTENWGFQASRPPGHPEGAQKSRVAVPAPVGWQ